MSRSRRLLALAPVVAAFAFSDKTLASFGMMLVGGLIFWIPYWLAWWLSDGFSIFTHPVSLDDDSVGTGYRSGTQGYGYYRGSHRVW